LRKVKLSGADLHNADLRGADLRGANLSGADLKDSILEDTLSMEDADLRDVEGLTPEQLEICKAKGAIIDEDSTTSSSQSPVSPSGPLQSNGTQVSSAPST
jgi:uncharacterized protein YjbI with pentapeptide repeats